MPKEAMSIGTAVYRAVDLLITSPTPSQLSVLTAAPGSYPSPPPGSPNMTTAVTVNLDVIHLLHLDLLSDAPVSQQDFREKNTDHMRPDIVALLRSSDRAFIRQLIGMYPVAMFRWAVLRAAVRGLAGFNQAGSRRAARTAGQTQPTRTTHTRTTHTRTTPEPHTPEPHTPLPSTLQA